MKKDRAIVFAVSKDLAFSVACVLMDITRISPNLADEAVVLHNGIKEKDQRLINSIFPTRFIHYRLPIDKTLISDDILNYFTEMVFAKFECLKLLDEYHNVLFTDTDVIFQKDVSELYDFFEYGFKILQDSRSSQKVSVQFKEHVEGYDMNIKCTATGIFVLQDHIKNYKKMYDFCYEALIKYHEKIYLPEQAIFDLMFQEFDIKIFPIDAEVYSPHPTDKKLAPSAKVIHAYGQPKFWNGLNDDRWNENYKDWVRLGGSRYNNNVFFKFFNKIKRYLVA